MTDAEKMKLASRLAKLIHYKVISLKEADEAWIKRTGEPVSWEQEYL